MNFWRHSIHDHEDGLSPEKGISGACICWGPCRPVLKTQCSPQRWLLCPAGNGADTPTRTKTWDQFLKKEPALHPSDATARGSLTGHHLLPIGTTPYRHVANSPGSGMWLLRVSPTHTHTHTQTSRYTHTHTPRSVPTVPGCLGSLLQIPVQSDHEEETETLAIHRGTQEVRTTHTDGEARGSGDPWRHSY